MLQFCYNDCNVWAEVNVKEQLSHLSANSRRPEHVKMLNEDGVEDGVENTLGIANYSFSLFFMKIAFILKAASSSWRVVDYSDYIHIDIRLYYIHTIIYIAIPACGLIYISVSLLNSELHIAKI